MTKSNDSQEGWRFENKKSKIANYLNHYESLMMVIKKSDECEIYLELEPSFCPCKATTNKLFGQCWHGTFPN